MSGSWLESLTIDGAPIPAWRKLTGLGSPPPRQDVRERAQRHGSIDRTRFYQPRLLEITDAVAVLEGSDPTTVWQGIDALKGAFALGTDHVVRFRRLGMSFDERVTCRVASELKADALYDSPGVLLWSVALLAADPRIYADVATTARYSPSTSDGGVVFPLTFPLSFSGGTTPGTTMTVTNAGNFETPPTFTVAGPADAGFSIVNETAGEAIVTTGAALTATDSLTIDVEARDVVILGTSRPDFIDAAASTWFELGAGNTLLRLHGSGFEADVTTLSVTFRDARI